MSLRDFFDTMEDGCAPAQPCYLQWSAKGVGFGELYFYEKDGKIYCDNELMGKEFIKRMLCKMVDDCELTCTRDT